MRDLTGKVAFITGSAGGIGLGIARACAAAGMRVVLSDIDAPELAMAEAELRSAGGEVLSVRLDVTSREDWARAADHIASLGPVQLLVNNAGVSTYGMEFDEIEPVLWDRVISTNLTAVYNGVHCFLGQMRTAGEGHIVNTASVGGLVGIALLTPYCATKFALVGLSESLRAELAGSGIGVSVLCPGTVRTRIRQTSRKAGARSEPGAATSDANAQPGAMEPDEVGRRVLAGVRADAPYIVTHPHVRGAVSQRHALLMGRGIPRVS
jgi:NAD(P)-dependent dehydrogenase (short-subunit alcohol dehydrogenase family)